MKRGFTLVELAIVLVVVGLVIGAILVGNSMRETARVHNTIRQLNQFDVAMSDFQTKYQFLPGDAPSLKFADGGEGNGNGKIEDAGGTVGIGRAWSGEVANFWAELSTTGLRSSDAYTAVISGGKLSVSGTDPNMPSVELGVKGTGIFVTNDNGILYSLYGIAGVYIIGKVTDNDGSDLSFPNTSGAGEIIEDALTPAAMLALDVKLDDGKPQSGRILAFSEGAAGTSTSCLTAATPPAYNLERSSAACSAAISYPIDGEDISPGLCNGGTVTPDPGCATAGGTWDQCSANCTCPGSETWDGANCNGLCGGGTVYPDPGYVGSGGTWDQCADSGTCPSGSTWDSGSNSCLSNCTPDPGCDMTDTNAPGSWNMTTCTCDCQGYNMWDPGSHSCQSTCSTPPPGCVSPGGVVFTWDPINCTCDCGGGSPISMSWDGTNCSCPSGTQWDGTSTCVDYATPCAASGGNWNVSTGCDCSGNPALGGSGGLVCGCADVYGSGPSCMTGSIESPAPDCACTDTVDCGNTGGIWNNSHPGGCDCSSSPNGPYFITDTGCEM